MERREFFQSLIAGGATVRKRGTHQKHNGGTVLYRGPMMVPEHVAAALAQNPGIYRASGRGTHLSSRYADRERNGKGSGAVYVFRCQIPTHRGMVGEIVLYEGHYGVHCWASADPGNYSEPLEIAARKIPAQNTTTVPLPLPTNAMTVNGCDDADWPCNDCDSPCPKGSDLCAKCGRLAMAEIEYQDNHPELRCPVRE